MTPYELRFNIFQEAEALADRQYQSEYAAVTMWNEKQCNSNKLKEFPTFPTFEYIKQLAENINNFVSSNSK